jgi:hypothetical protein
MGITLEVQVLTTSRPSQVKRTATAEGRPTVREESGERSRGPTKRNGIRGAAERGERAKNRKASMAETT